jgi:hypothetical protein
MTTAQVATYTVEACNLSHASENKIHDDQVARKLGFSGGLVPGVEVYAYACHPLVRRWGRDWLAHGRMECRFLKPVYDGRLALVKAGDAQCPAWTGRRSTQTLGPFLPIATRLAPKPATS